MGHISGRMLLRLKCLKIQQKGSKLFLIKGKLDKRVRNHIVDGVAIPFVNGILENHRDRVPKEKAHRDHTETCTWITPPWVRTSLGLPCLVYSSRLHKATTHSPAMSLGSSIFLCKGSDTSLRPAAEPTTPQKRSRTNSAFVR